LDEGNFVSRPVNSAQVSRPPGRIGKVGGTRRSIMAPKQKRRSVMDRLRDLLDKLDQLGPLLNPPSLQPVPIPARNPERRRR
jgi:hypothetical protein